MTALLSIQDLVVDYGKIRALKGLTLDVAEGELVAVIGSNGAGKTTLMRTISSLLRPTSGSITFQGKDLISAPAHEVVRRGLCALLQAQPDWEVCGEAADGREALEKTQKLKPDVVILDIGMPS